MRNSYTSHVLPQEKNQMQFLDKFVVNAFMSCMEKTVSISE